MKKIGKNILLLLIAAIFCTGCGKKTDNAKELKNLENVFAEYPDTLTEQEKTDDGVTVQLHHAAFEAQRLILDYTVKADNLDRYRSCVIEVCSDTEESVSCSLDCSLYFEEKKNEYRIVGLYEWKGEKLQKEDVGEKIQIQLLFSEVYAENLQSDSISFEVEPSRIFETKQVEVHQDIAYEKGNATVEGLEISPFYTGLIMEHSENEEFLNGFFSYEITDEEGESAVFKGGADDNLFYSSLPENCRKVGITVIQYGQDGAYDSVSEKLEVEIP